MLLFRNSVVSGHGGGMIIVALHVFIFNQGSLSIASVFFFFFFWILLFTCLG
jgi:hypothetical protein